MAFSGFFSASQARVAIRRLERIGAQNVTLLKSEEMVTGLGAKSATSCQGHAYILKASVPVGGWTGHLERAPRTFYNTADLREYCRCYGHLHPCK